MNKYNTPCLLASWGTRFFLISQLISMHTFIHNLKNHNFDFVHKYVKIITIYCCYSCYYKSVKKSYTKQFK